MPEYKGILRADDPIVLDFRNFLYVAWKHLLLPIPTLVQYDIAQYLCSPEHDRKMVEAFRGVGKSWITSAKVCWGLLGDPQDKFLVVSASKSRSDDFSIFTKRLILEMPILNHLIPRRDQRQSNIAFDVAPARASHAPSVKSVGVFGQMTGSRANHIIADDIESAQNSMTQDRREKLIDTVMEFEAILSPGGDITYLGTPQSEESVYNRLRSKGYHCNIWPSRVPDDETIEGYQGGLAPMILQMKEDGTAVGTPTDPERFNEIELLKRETAYGRTGFALQFMLDTRLSDALRYPLKTSDIIVSSVGIEKAPASIQYGSSKEQLITDLRNPGFSGDRWYEPMYYDKDNFRDYELRAMVIDPSGRGKDETSFAVGLQLNGNIWIPEVDGSKSFLPDIVSGYDDQVLTYLAKKAKQYKVHDIIIEDNFGDGMFTKMFQPVLFKYHRCQVEEIKQHLQKEIRIVDTLEPVMNSHRLIMSKAVIEHDLNTMEAIGQAYSLFYQMTRLTKEKGALHHDDRLDALAMLVGHFLEVLDVYDLDQERVAQAAELDDELEVHIRLCQGESIEEILAGANQKIMVNTGRRI